MEGSLSGRAIVYFSSIGQHGCCTHHGAPMTDTSSRLAMGSCWIAVHLDGLIHSSVPPFFQLPLHASIHFLMQSRFSCCFCSMCYLVGRIRNPRCWRSSSGMLIIVVPVSITVWAWANAVCNHWLDHISRTSVRVLAPSVTPPHTFVPPPSPSAPRRCWTLYLYFALCSSFSFGRLPSYLAPLLATQYRWGESFLSLLLWLSYFSTVYLRGTIQSAHSKVPKGLLVPLPQ